MDAVEKANAERQKKWCETVSFSVDSLTHISVCLQGKSTEDRRGNVCRRIQRYGVRHRNLKLAKSPILSAGREVATGRKVAIKKIKVGQFKDGLDMSAIREVKYLRELKHQNVIEVGAAAAAATALCHIT